MPADLAGTSPGSQPAASSSPAKPGATITAAPGIAQHIADLIENINAASTDR